MLHTAATRPSVEVVTTEVRSVWGDGRTGGESGHRGDLGELAVCPLWGSTRYWLYNSPYALFYCVMDHKFTTNNTKTFSRGLSGDILSKNETAAPAFAHSLQCP